MAFPVDNLGAEGMDVDEVNEESGDDSKLRILVVEGEFFGHPSPFPGCAVD